MNHNFFKLIFLSLATFLVSDIAFSQNDEPSRIAEPAPVISISEIEHNFGDVAQGKELEHDFIVKNTGKADLVIRDLNPSCGCTAAVLKEPVISSGSYSAIRVSFNTTGFTGEKSKTVRVYSNDPVNPSVVLKVKANIIPEIYTEPSRIDFSGVKRGSSPEKKIYLKSIKEKTNSFKDVKSKSDYLKVSSKNLDNNEVEITVKVTENTPSGKHRTRIVIDTSNKRIPVINIPVVIDVESDISITPKALNFGYHKGQIEEPLQKKIYIEKKTTSKNIKINKVSSSINVVSAKMYPMPGDKYQIEVKLLPKARGVIRGNIILELDHPDPNERKIEIPLYAVVDRDAD